MIFNVPTHPDSNEKNKGLEKRVATTFYKTLQMRLLAITLSYSEFMTSRRYIN